MKNETEAKGETPFDKFRQFAKEIISVPKAEIDRMEKQYQKARTKKKRT